MSSSSPASTAQSLSAPQVGHVLELLEVRELAPREAMRQLDELSGRGMFSESQALAIRILLMQDPAEVSSLLRASCEDEDCLDLVRSRLVHEARMTYVRG
jgi:hypothetical protein